MVRIYGYSDDLVEIEGSRYKFREIDCYESDVRIKFDDGAVIRVGFGKPVGSIWYVILEKVGTAPHKLNICIDEDDSPYSDVFITEAEVVSHRLVKHRPIEAKKFDPSLDKISEVTTYHVSCDGGRFKLGNSDYTVRIPTNTDAIYSDVSVFNNYETFKQWAAKKYGDFQIHALFHFLNEISGNFNVYESDAPDSNVVETLQGTYHLWRRSNDHEKPMLAVVKADETSRCVFRRCV